MLTTLTGLIRHHWPYLVLILLAVPLLVLAWKLLFKLSRLSWKRLALVGLVVLCICFLFVLPRFYLPELTPGFPPGFRRQYWSWVLAFTLGTVFPMAYLVRMIRVWRSATVADTLGESAGRFPDLDAAWREILLRLDRAQINLSRQHVYLLIGPHEETAATLMRSAGLPLYAEAPEGPAPIHAYATADGVLLSCAGASALGCQDAEGVARLEYLAGLLLSRDPECPVVRGVAILFPIDWAVQPDAVAMAAAVRDDLRALERVLKVHCPVFALFPQLEIEPGIPEFLARMPPELKQKRCGFALPSSVEFDGDVVHRGLSWMSGWFHTWSLSLLARDLLDLRGNGELVLLGQEFRKLRRRLRSLMESAFSTHRESVPVLLRGCYFMATGAGPDEQAFSAGLFHGARSRVLADHVMTEWTDEALEDDRRYHRLAWIVALIGGFFVLVVWAYIIFALTSAGWLGLLAIVILWVVVLTRIAL